MGFLQGISDYRQLNRNLYKLSKSQFAPLRDRQLLDLLEHTLRNSSFYRGLYGIQTSDAIDRFLSECRKDPEFLKRAFTGFPTINKQIAMDHFDDLNTCGLRKNEVAEFALQKELAQDYTGYFKDRFVVGLSSGTSGNKGIFITPKELTRRLPFVFLARGGIPLRLLPFRILFLLRVFSQGFSDIRAPLIHLSYKSTMTPVDELVEYINRNRIHIIMAPPSMLRILMTHSDRIRVRIRMIISYAEVLEKEEKARISAAFRSEVREIYQASEGQIGSTCRCGQLHINEDLVYVELYDEHGEEITRPGVVASRMIITNLINFAMPLIRYEMNDLIALGEPCPCGSSFRVIEKILGRNDDVLFLRDRNGTLSPVFPDLFARWIITADDRIREFKVLLHSPQSLEILVDLYRSTPEEEPVILQRLRERVISALDQHRIDCNLTITVTTIPLPEKKSKYKRFVNRSAVNEPLSDRAMYP
jgi:putative adenylate-forming enzyme